jgi:hypothetical protein
MSDHGLIAHPESHLERPELEHAGLAGRTYFISSRIAGACLAFYFLGFLFAYVYLKTLDTHARWHPQHVNPSTGTGVAVLVLALAGLAAYEFGYRALAASLWNKWRTALRASLVLTLAATGVLMAQLFDPGFPYGIAAFASVFVGAYWSVVLALFGVLYTVGTLSAQSHRVPPESREHLEDLSSPAALRPAAEATRFVLLVLGAVEVLAFVGLYLVR